VRGLHLRLKSGTLRAPKSLILKGKNQT